MAARQGRQLEEAQRDLAAVQQELAATKTDLEAAWKEAGRQEDDAQLAWGELDEYKRHMASEVAFARQEAIREMRGGPPHATSLQTVVAFETVAVTRCCCAVPGMNRTIQSIRSASATSAPILSIPCCPTGGRCDLLECTSAGVIEVC